MPAGRGGARRGLRGLERAGHLPLDPPPSASHPVKTALVSFWIRRPRPAAQGRSPFPTTRGLGLGAQERIDFLEGEPAARRGDARRGRPPSRVGARVTCCPRPPAGCRPETREARAKRPQPCRLEQRARGGGEASGTKRGAAETAAARVLAEDRRQLQKGLH